MKITTDTVKDQEIAEVASAIKPIGKTKDTSISKIKKIKVIIKNRNEKGARDFFIGEKPHSNGVIFSRSLLVFSLVTSVNNNITALKIKATIIIKDNVIIKNLTSK